MLKTLYDIQAEHAALVTELLDADGELTPELEMALSINEDELEAKAEGYALRILDFNGQSELIAAEIKRLQARQQQYEKTADKLKETIKAAMIQFNKDKIKTNRITLSFRKSEVVEVPEEFTTEVLNCIVMKAEIDHEKIEGNEDEVAIKAAALDNLLQYFKLSATVDKTKIKTALKEGTTVGDVMLITKQNLQIK